MELSRMRLGPATTYALAVANGYTGTLEQFIKDQKGAPGTTPRIGANGNWYIGETDTGVKAAGADGKTPHIGANGNWWIGDDDTGIAAEGKAATIEIVGTETLEAGQPAAVEEADGSTPQARKYKFKVPQGVSGKDGLGVPTPTAEDAGKVPVVLADGSYGLGSQIPPPETAEVGQTIVVKAVDENGKPTEWEAADIASGGGNSGKVKLWSGNVGQGSFITLSENFDVYDYLTLTFGISGSAQFQFVTVVNVSSVLNAMESIDEILLYSPTSFESTTVFNAATAKLYKNDHKKLMFFKSFTSTFGHPSMLEVWGIRI